MAARDTKKNTEINRNAAPLFSQLVCPVSLSTLIYDASTSELISLQSRYAYPVVDGVPRMHSQAARFMSDSEYEQRRRTQRTP